MDKSSRKLDTSEIENAQPFLPLLDSTKKLQKLIPEQYSIISSDKHDPSTLFRTAMAQAGLFRFNDAIHTIDKAIAKDSKVPDYHFLKGECLASMMQFEEALKSYGNCLRIDPRHVQCIFFSAKAHAELGHIEKAAFDFGVAAQIDPSFANASFEKGCMLFELKLMKEAIEAFEVAQAADPSCEEIPFNQGVAEFSLGRFREAIESFDRAISISPDYVEAHFYKAQALERTGKLSLALQTLDYISDKQGLYFEVHLLRIRFLLQNGKTKQALEALDRLLVENEAFDEAYYIKAALQIREKMEREAMDSISKGIFYNSNNYLYYLFRAALNLPDDPIQAQVDAKKGSSLSSMTLKSLYVENEYVQSLSSEYIPDARPFADAIFSLLNPLSLYQQLFDKLKKHCADIENRANSIIKEHKFLCNSARKHLLKILEFRNASLNQSEVTADLQTLSSQAEANLERLLFFQNLIKVSLPSENLVKIFNNEKSISPEIFEYASAFYFLFAAYIQSYDEEKDLEAIPQVNSHDFLMFSQSLEPPESISAISPDSICLMIDRTCPTIGSNLDEKRKALLEIFRRKKESLNFSPFCYFWAKIAIYLTQHPPLRERILKSKYTPDESKIIKTFQETWKDKAFASVKPLFKSKTQKKAAMDVILLLELFRETKSKFLSCTDRLEDMILIALLRNEHLTRYVAAKDISHKSGVFSQLLSRISE